MNRFVRSTFVVAALACSSWTGCGHGGGASDGGSGGTAKNQDAGTLADQDGGAIVSFDGGTQSEVLYTGPNCTSTNLVVTDQYLYFGQLQSSATPLINRVDKDGSNFTTLVMDEPSNLGNALLAVSSTSIFWASADPATNFVIRSAHLDGSSPTVVAHSVSPAGANGMAADGDTLYYSDTQGVHAVQADGSAPRLVIAGMAYGVELANGGIYWNDPSNTNFVKTDGTGSTVVLPYLAKVVTDSHYLYTASSSGKASDGLYRRNLDGSNPRLLNLGAAGVLGPPLGGGVYFPGPGGIWFVDSDGNNLRYIGDVTYAGSLMATVLDPTGLYFIGKDTSACTITIGKLPL